MHPYHLALAAGSVISGVCAGCIFGQNPGRRDGQLAALLLLGAAWWGICELAWNMAPDAASARKLMQLSAPGWAFVWPLLLHIFARSAVRSSQGLGAKLTVLYGGAAVFLVLAGSTNLMLGDVARTSWGWQYGFGPAIVPYGVYVAIGAGWAVKLSLRGRPRGTSGVAERPQPVVFLPCLIPLTVAAFTDVALPTMGFHFPGLGSIAFAALGPVAVWSVRRHGGLPLSPGNFADKILDTLPDGVLLVRANGRIRSVNSAIVKLSGRPKSELIEMRWNELFGRGVSRDGADAAAEECELRCASGTSTPVLVRSSRLRDRQGNEIGMVLVVHDISEIKDLRARVILSARLAAVGELAAGVAHEINNPIAFVRSNLSQLHGHWKTLCQDLADRIRELELYEIAEEGRELIDESIEGVDRAAEIVRGIRGFSHGGTGDRELANLNEMIEDVLHMAASQMQSNISIERYYVELPPVHCAPQEIKQVFLNLIVNAGRAVGNGGTIRIKTEVQDAWVIAHVEDDGAGIPPEIIDRIFDPFFTTRSDGGGTGLSLGIADQITRSHGGEISVDSTPGEGARFHVRLPSRPAGTEADRAG